MIQLQLELFVTSTSGSTFLDEGQSRKVMTAVENPALKLQPVFFFFLLHLSS